MGDLASFGVTAVKASSSAVGAALLDAPKEAANSPAKSPRRTAPAPDPRHMPPWLW